MANPDNWITEGLLDRVLLGLDREEPRARRVLRSRLRRLSITIDLFKAQRHRPSSRVMAKRAVAMHNVIEKLLGLIATKDDDGRWRADLDQSDFGLSLAAGLGLVDDPDNLERDLQSGALKRRLQRDIDRIQRWQSVAEATASDESARVRKGRGGKRHAADPVKNHIIADLTATYIEITGKRPRVSKEADKATGPFIKFCEIIFSAMGLPTEPDAIAQQYRRHLVQQRGTNQKSSTD